MISKKDFCKAIKLIQDHRKKEDKLCEALQTLDSDCAGVFLFAKYEELVLDLLTKDLCPDSDMIYWWVYDAECGKASYDFCTIEKEGKKYLIMTAEVLYDFLTDKADPLD